MSKYLSNAVRAHVNPPQTEPLNERQVQNSAGGYSFPVDCWTRLDRFLILGSEGGSYYATEKKLTKENLGAVEECVKADGIRTVNRIVEISNDGRAPKNDPALLALAFCAANGNPETKSLALSVLPKVARIGTHLFHFVSFVQELRGWGRSLKRGIADWYKSQSVERLAEQVTKYQQRDGMSHRDLLRLCHVEFIEEEKDAIARWVLKQSIAPRELRDRSGSVVRAYPATTAPHPHIVAHEQLQAATDPREAARLIREHGLVRESVPTELLKAPEVWDALLDRMPITALIRNLGNLSKNKVLVPLGSRVKEVCDKIIDPEILRKGRVHPIQLLMALKTYGSGHGLRGSGEWTVVPQVVDALDAAYYLAFKNLEPTGKRFYLALDISGSMGSGSVAGIPGFTPMIASGAMAMTVVHSEQNYYCAGFTAANRYLGRGQAPSDIENGMTPCRLSSRMRLDDVVREMERLSMYMAGTDCALPMLDALNKKIPVDVFVVYTDSETWAGRVHPVKALQDYRRKMGIAAKLVVVGMVANEFSIADPKDGGMLDVVGFDASTPAIISDFAK